MSSKPIRNSHSILCTVLALGQVLLFTTPVMAQQANYWGDGRIFPYNRGYASPIGPWSHTTGPQFGYSAVRGHRRGTGSGTAIGMCMLGGIVGLGALSMGSQLLSRRSMMKKHNNPNAPADRIASKDRREKQQMKIKGELDQDYQKEMAEKNLAMAPGGASPLGMGSAPGAMGMTGASDLRGAPGMSGMGSMNTMNGMSAPAPMAPGQPIAPAQNMMTPAFQSNGNAGAPAAFQGGPTEAPVLNPTPWTPGGDLAVPQF